jgi:hypothetical protein
LVVEIVQKSFFHGFVCLKHECHVFKHDDAFISRMKYFHLHENISSYLYVHCLCAKHTNPWKNDFHTISITISWDGKFVINVTPPCLLFTFLIASCLGFVGLILPLPQKCLCRYLSGRFQVFSPNSVSLSFI